MKSKNNPRIQSARFCPACGNQTAVPKGEKSPWHPLTRRQIEALPDLIEFARTIAQAGESGPLSMATWHDAKAMARAALAKAEGGTLERA